VGGVEFKSQRKGRIRKISMGERGKEPTAKLGEGGRGIGYTKE
jgi:hypothetical protein